MEYPALHCVVPFPCGRPLCSCRSAPHCQHLSSTSLQHGASTPARLLKCLPSLSVVSHRRRAWLMLPILFCLCTEFQPATTMCDTSSLAFPIGVFDFEAGLLFLSRASEHSLGDTTRSLRTPTRRLRSAPCACMRDCVSPRSGCCHEPQRRTSMGNDPWPSSRLPGSCPSQCSATKWPLARHELCPRCFLTN